MAVHTSLLLVIALCAATAHSLRCYTCMSQISNAQCLTPEICPDGESHCKTTMETFKIAGTYTSTYTKACASFCSKIRGFSTSVSCCSTDLCNVSGTGASITASCVPIILALGALLTILKSSVL
ncbi:lymphocyte antigen 6E-like isoform 1-T2 [Anomaloglossus baeobatrachus]|uniref:lymphocyte antigen 6E-like n=1 Tax=Anomaloglossus baeobatrachus TaxID=238106 RepID=UPI003F4F81D8